MHARRPGDDDLEFDQPCHPRLTCARETSVLHSGISDECGLAGAVCSHGLPMLGCMLAMPAHKVVRAIFESKSQPQDLRGCPR